MYNQVGRNSCVDNCMVYWAQQMMMDGINNNKGKKWKGEGTKVKL